jgi:hypothetical protein
MWKREEDSMDTEVQVYSVVRVDEYSSGRDAITVKEVLPTMEEVEKEVERLNRANGNKGYYYFWQTTRYFPEGKALNKDDAPPKHPLHIPSLPGSES